MCVYVCLCVWQCVCLCVSACLCMDMYTCVEIALETRRENQIPWSWSCWQLWAAWYRFWELNSVVLFVSSKHLTVSYCSSPLPLSKKGLTWNNSGQFLPVHPMLVDYKNPLPHSTLFKMKNIKKMYAISICNFKIYRCSYSFAWYNGVFIKHILLATDTLPPS